MIRSIFLLLVFVLSVCAQSTLALRPRNVSELPRIYVAACDMNLSAAAGACTIQQPATAANNVRLISASIYCSVSCQVTQERNGTAATSTPVTVIKVNPDKSDAASAMVFTNSDTSSPSSTIPKMFISSGTENGVSYPDTVYLIGYGTTKNYTFRSNSITGEFKVSLMWEEYN